MTDLTRRKALAIGAAAALPPLAQAAAPSDFVPIGASPLAGPSQNPADRAMEIQRIGIIPAATGLPAISLAAAHQGLVYLCGITADPEKLGDVKDQTRQVLERMDRLLAKAGTSKSRLLTAQVWLTDMSHFAGHNAAWNEWVDPKNPPARACLHSPQLWRPGLLVEIMATAAR